MRTSSFLEYWLWMWPGSALLIMVWGFVDPSAFRQCPHVYWTFPLIGVSAAGWTWLRTFHHRYLPQALASAVLFALGAWMYWK